MQFHMFGSHLFVYVVGLYLDAFYCFFLSLERVNMLI